jgi:hypothetical protein
MPDWWKELTAAPGMIALAVVAAGMLVAAVVFAIRNHRNRPTAAELERRRRAQIHQTGKMGDGEIVDVEKESASIIYSYSVAGVVYTASQDLTALESSLPPDVMTMVGPVMVKFDPRNPANSIVICEEWSGLRNREHPTGKPLSHVRGSVTD